MVAQMSFTEAQLQAQLNAEGLTARITNFMRIDANTTDVYAQNINSTSRKFGGLQIPQSNTAAQAAALLKAALSA